MTAMVAANQLLDLEGTLASLVLPNPQDIARHLLVLLGWPSSSICNQNLQCKNIFHLGPPKACLLPSNKRMLCPT